MANAWHAAVLAAAGQGLISPPPPISPPPDRCTTRGGWQPQGTIAKGAPGANPGSVQLADINGDGKADSRGSIPTAARW
jgi:hypothetical protein